MIHITGQFYFHFFEKFIFIYYVYYSTIHNNQDMEPTLVSVNRLMGKEKMVLIHNGILSSHTKDVILSHVVTWLNLKGIMLSEIS
jgi:hypothetical protein